MSIEGCPHGPYDPAECAECKSVAEHHQAVTAHAEAKIKTIAESIQDEKDKIIQGLEADLAKCREERKWALVGRDTLQLELDRFKRIGLQLEAERDRYKEAVSVGAEYDETNRQLRERITTLEAWLRKDGRHLLRCRGIVCGEQAPGFCKQCGCSCGLTDLIGKND